MKETIRITFKPHEKALKTTFKIHEEDLKTLIEWLINNYTNLMCDKHGFKESDCNLENE